MTVCFGGFDHGVNGSARFGPFGCIRKKPILSAEDKRPDGIFDQVVVRALQDRFAYIESALAIRSGYSGWPFQEDFSEAKD